MTEKRMPDNAAIIRNTIIEVAITEDNELRQICGQGIFWMPELAFAYKVGKALAVKKFEWSREEKLDGAGGPVDLVLKKEDEVFAIEFKLRDTSDKYVADLNKLSAIRPPDCQTLSRLFCALVDVWSANDEEAVDERISAIMTAGDNRFTTHLIGGYCRFSTNQTWYTKPVDCQLGVWEVNPTSSSQ